MHQTLEDLKLEDNYGMSEEEIQRIRDKEEDKEYLGHTLKLLMMGSSYEITEAYKTTRWLCNKHIVA